MNGFGLLVKTTALSSSILLVTAFIAMRTGFFEHHHDLFAALPTADPNDVGRSHAFDLEFTLVGESTPRAMALTDESFSGSANDQDWLKSAFGSGQNAAFIQVSQEACRDLAEEIIFRPKDDRSAISNDKTLMSGSKVIVLDWTSNGLIAGGHSSLGMTAGSQILEVDENPVQMFSETTNPLFTVVPAAVLQSNSNPTVLAIPVRVDSSPTRPPRILSEPEERSLTVISGSKSLIIHIGGEQ